MNDKKPIIVRNGRIIDPGQGIDRVADLLVIDGLVNTIDVEIEGIIDEQQINAKGLVVCPGFIDIHCHLREPGFESKETIRTGTKAAVSGGFTTVCAMPNTDPVTDSSAVVQLVQQIARSEGVARVFNVGAVTKGSNGNELAQLAELADAGVIGFSDDGSPVSDPNIMRNALSYSSMFGLPIINHCEVRELSYGGVMNEGRVSDRLGLKGIPNASEEIMVARDIALSELTGGWVHIAHASTAGAVEIIKHAKEKGIKVTCEVTPHHLTLSDDTVIGGGNSSYYSLANGLANSAYDTNAKVSPPLRTKADVEAMVEALKTGVVDLIATDHAPHSELQKNCTFEEADFGISVLETALGSMMSLVHNGDISLHLMIDKLTSAPAKFLRKPYIGTFKQGNYADVTIFDPDAEWKVDSSKFASKSGNTPLDGKTMKGKIVTTIMDGIIRYEDKTGYRNLY